MKFLIFSLLILSFSSLASVVGISAHQHSEEARVLSVETAGHFSHRHEMSAGLRYTHGFSDSELMDIAIGSGQYSRGLTLGLGMDFELLKDEGNQPRFSLKPFFQHQKFDSTKHSNLGFAPILRKGFNVSGLDFYPYFALPSGMLLDSETDEFKYFAEATLGMSFAIPGTQEALALAFEGSKNLGSANDYLGLNISWVWK